jgi:sporulation protein YlmC with PRC-barrel domain
MYRKEELDGKIVIEASGKALGKAKDIAFGLDGSIALIVAGNDNSEIQITMDRIAGVADYIVVRRLDAAPKKPQAAATVAAPAPAQARVVRPTAAVAPAPVVAAAMVCKNCGAPLKAGAKFCTKCGTPT